MNKMIQLTNFSEFRRVVESLGFPILIAEIEDALRSGRMDADPNNLVVGMAGIYSVIEKEGNTFLTKIILHIADYNLRFLERSGQETANSDFHNDRFDSRALVKAIHKYHFFHCQTLDDMFAHGRRDRYKQSHRKDGKFAYQFIKEKVVVRDRQDQKLNPCRHCLNMLQNYMGRNLSVETFNPSIFFDEIPPLHWLPDCGYQLDTQHVPPRYVQDFQKIHQKIKKRKNYHCEICGIDLSERNLQKYADCHHDNANPADNRIANLKCLCIKCHAEQFQHAHMKRLPRYLEFLPVWHELHGA